MDANAGLHKRITVSESNSKKRLGAMCLLCGREGGCPRGLLLAMNHHCGLSTYPGWKVHSIQMDRLLSIRHNSLKRCRYRGV